MWGKCEFRWAASPSLGMVFRQTVLSFWDFGLINNLA